MHAVAIDGNDGIPRLQTVVGRGNKFVFLIPRVIREIGNRIGCQCGWALPEIFDDEIPFDIPDTWRWVRLGDCSTYTLRKEKVSLGDITDDMWSLDLEDIEKGTGRVIQYFFEIWS